GFDALPFSSLYLLDDEWAAETANRTMHGVLHLGWIPDETGGYRGQMAVLVKPNGLRGTAYMAAIRPFRHLIVYPALLREGARTWRAHRGHPGPSHGALDPGSLRRLRRRRSGGRGPLAICLTRYGVRGARPLPGGS